MLQYIYNLEIDICAPILPAFATIQDAKKISTLQTMIDIYVAADKYGIPGLQDAIIATFISRLQWISKPETLVSLADSIYENTMAKNLQGEPDRMRKAISSFIQDHLKSMLANSTARDALLQNQELNADLLQQVADASNQPKTLSASLKRQREVGDVEDTQELRRSERNKGIHKRYNFLHSRGTF